MSRVDRLFLRLWILVFSLLLYKSYNQNMKFVKHFSHHAVGITLPLLVAVDNKDQLAAIIAHEIAHIQLGHTVSNKHNINMEYDSDLLSIYYLKKAGYGICGAQQYWEKSKRHYTELAPTSHPNTFTRAYYMSMPECKNKPVKEEVVTIQDAIDIFNQMQRHVAGKNRYNTKFEIGIFALYPNAYAYTEFKTKD